MAVLDAGPILTWVRDTAANVWFKLDSAGTATVKIGSQSWSQAVTSATDFTGHVAVSGIDAARTHSYSLYVDGLLSAESSFTTMPTEGSPGRFVMSVLNDLHQSWQDAGASTYAQSFGRIEDFLDSYEGVPQFSVLDGDFELPTGQQFDLDQRRAEFRILRRSVPDDPGHPDAGAKGRLMARLPAYHVWDDHDGYGNNWAGKSHTPAEQAVPRQVYDEYWSGAPPGPDALSINRAFVVADCLVMLTDGRTYRDPCPTSSPSAVGWDYLADNDLWGTDQLQWIKDTLSDNAEAPFKFMFVGTTFVDHNNLFVPGRDSIGIFYRKQRNDLLAFLEQNPSFARGLYVLTGDDHHNSVRVPTRWRDQEPYPGILQPVAAEWPSHAYVPIVELKCGIENAEAALGRPWHGSLHEVMFRTGESILVVDVNTERDPPVARFGFRGISETKQTELYYFDSICGLDHFPDTGYRTTKSGGYSDPSAAYSPDAPPGTGWTPDPGPP